MKVKFMGKGNNRLEDIIKIKMKSERKDRYHSDRPNQ